MNFFQFCIWYMCFEDISLFKNDKRKIELIQAALVFVLQFILIISHPIFFSLSFRAHNVFGLQSLCILVVVSIERCLMHFSVVDTQYFIEKAFVHSKLSTNGENDIINLLFATCWHYGIWLLLFKFFLAIHVRSFQFFVYFCL